MMSKDELKKRLDAIIGLASTSVDTCEETLLQYHSPTGVLLFELNIYKANVVDGGWYFGGQSNALPNTWIKLCRASKRPITTTSQV